MAVQRGSINEGDRAPAPGRLRGVHVGYARRPGHPDGSAEIDTKVGNHTAYLKNGGTLEKEMAAAMANHASTHTTQLYDRRRDEMSLDEMERS